MTALCEHQRLPVSAPLPRLQFHPPFQGLATGTCYGAGALRVDTARSVGNNLRVIQTPTTADPYGQNAQRARLWGIAMLGAATAALAALVEGLRRRSYWAIALPVIAFSTGALYILVWVGKVLATSSRADFTPLEQDDSA
jgi:hypothetical protein